MVQGSQLLWFGRRYHRGGELGDLTSTAASSTIVSLCSGKAANDEANVHWIVLAVLLNDTLWSPARDTLSLNGPKWKRARDISQPKLLAVTWCSIVMPNDLVRSLVVIIWLAHGPLFLGWTGANDTKRNCDISMVFRTFFWFPPESEAWLQTSCNQWKETTTNLFSNCKVE